MATIDELRFQRSRIKRSADGVTVNARPAPVTLAESTAVAGSGLRGLYTISAGAHTATTAAAGIHNRLRDGDGRGSVATCGARIRLSATGAATGAGGAAGRGGTGGTSGDAAVLVSARVNAGRAYRTLSCAPHKGTRAANQRFRRMLSTMHAFQGARKVFAATARSWGDMLSELTPSRVVQNPTV